MMKLLRKRYYCICEGQQEQMYLAHVAKLLTDFPTRVVRFDTVQGSAARLKKDIRYVQYDAVVLFDHDMNDAKFAENIRWCEKLNREQSKRKKKERQKIYHAYSNMNFDLWPITLIKI